MPKANKRLINFMPSAKLQPICECGACFTSFGTVNFRVSVSVVESLTMLNDDASGESGGV